MSRPFNQEPLFKKDDPVVVGSPNGEWDGQRGKVIKVWGDAFGYSYGVELEDGRKIEVWESKLEAAQ